MGSGASRLLTACACSRPAPAPADDGPCLDDALGHSFCYAASSATAAGHSSSFRHAISGAALSANSSVPVPIYHSSVAGGMPPPQYSSAFHTSSSFSSAPLQLSNLSSGPLFLSGPIDRGAQLSGPLDQAVPLSGPLPAKPTKPAPSLRRSVSEKNRPCVVPLRREDGVQWAHGRAGEDRVHVVVSEDQRWLFVGIYDGFNGPEAPDFLVANLYRFLLRELRGSSTKRPTRTPSDSGNSWWMATTRTANSTSRAPAGSRYRFSRSSGIPCGPTPRCRWRWDDDVYVMNLGDSRSIVAQRRDDDDCLIGSMRVEGIGVGLETESRIPGYSAIGLEALQLSTDHSTSIEEEVQRIRREHPDDDQCIVNDRVKGRLKVTRAFGAGYLKQAKLNDGLLEMFRNEYIGDTPYISCAPSLCHHKLSTRDQFLVLSSDGLYQYLSNEEVVLHVENFMERFPEGDPAQSLIEELLSRAAKKAVLVVTKLLEQTLQDYSYSDSLRSIRDSSRSLFREQYASTNLEFAFSGMDFYELLDIPQGDRRKYHDDVTIMVISLEGRIWKSSGTYV
ncbi:unnamed protein product [Miscanthus lutarioriparius]|uniref:protein-serine/threonine phosphatase n=1 Tax=Miscanthus lutarioriparius TaxID=422564 RepID=A0A811PF02_9POAL|nr:unnamed protein product [Miscanthus lutarioriparius]